MTDQRDRKRLPERRLYRLQMILLVTAIAIAVILFIVAKYRQLRAVWELFNP